MGSKIEKHVIELAFAFALVTLLLISEFSQATYAEIEYWVIKAGDETLAVTTGKEDAEMAIDSIEHYYTNDEYDNVRVKSNPALTIEKKIYDKANSPEILTTSEITEKVIKETKKKDPLLKISTVRTVTSKVKINQGTIYRKTDKVIEDGEKVYSQGRKGIKEVERRITTVNGQKTSSVVVSTRMMRKPRSKVVLMGTGKDSKEDKESNAGSAGKAFNVKKASKIYRASLNGETMGKKVANYAMNFRGNPYVYGGTSLTKGADCSGFTYSVYRHFGVKLPRGAIAQQSAGKDVNLKNARPGDLILFPDHVGIYIGKNKIVHAMNVANGITVSKIGYNGKPIVAVRRLFV